MVTSKNVRLITVLPLRVQGDFLIILTPFLMAAKLLKFAQFFFNVQVTTTAMFSKNIFFHAI